MVSGMIRDKRKQSLILSVLFIIFMTDTSFISLNANSKILTFVKVFIVVVALLCIFREMKISKNLLLLLISIAITIIITDSLFKITYYVFISIILFCYYFSKKYTIREFAHYYILVMRIVSVISLICWLFPQFFVRLNFFPQFTSIAGAQYRFLGATTIPMLTHMQNRNFGPFWEPGVFQVYLSVAIFLLLFVNNNRKKMFDLVLFLIVEFTTLSGMSLIPVGLIIAAYLLKEKNIKAFFVVLISIVVFIILIYTGIFDVILLKITGQDSNSSFLFRWIGIEGGLKSFLSQPLFGSSFAESQQIRNELSIKYLGISYGSNTNTFINYYGMYGFFIGTFFLWSSYRFFKQICTSKIICSIAFLAYFLSTSNENLTGSLLVVAIALMGYFGKLNNED